MSLGTKSKSVPLIDARGPRYSAALTTIVLSAALITESNLIIGFQFAVFYQRFCLEYVDQFMAFYIAI